MNELKWEFKSKWEMKNIKTERKIQSKMNEIPKWMKSERNEIQK